MLDESAKKIVDGVAGQIAYNVDQIRRAHRYPIDSMPVSVREIAYYRNALLASLKDHNETLDRIRRLLTAGGDPVIDLWCEVYALDDKHGCHPRSPDPRQDGDPEG